MREHKIACHPKAVPVQTHISGADKLSTLIREFRGGLQAESSPRFTLSLIMATLHKVVTPYVAKLQYLFRQAYSKQVETSI